MATDHYDVVIIGSGAGGGRLAWSLAPTGKRILLLERGDYLPPGARQLGHGGRLPSRPLHHDRAVGGRGRRRLHARAELLRRGGTPSSTGPRCSGSARRTSGRSSPRRHLTGLAPRLPGLRAVVRAGRAALRGARRRRGGPDRRPAERRLPVPRGAARAPHPAAPRRPRAAGAPPVAPADRGDARPGRAGRRLHTSRCIRCDRVDGFPCLVHAKADAETVCVDPRPWRTQRRRWSRTPRSSGSRPTVTAVGSPRSSSSLGDGIETASRAASSWSPAARPTRRSCCCARPTTPTRRAGERVGPGRPQLHVPQQRGDDGAVPEPNPTEFQKTLALNDWYLKGEDDSTTRGAASRCSARPTDCSSARPPTSSPGGAHLALKTLESVAHHSVDFWLSSEDLPTADNRVTIDPGRHHAPGLRGDEPEGSSACARSSSRCSAPGDARRVAPPEALPHEAMDIAATAHQAGTVRFGTTRRPRSSTPTARPTRSTTSTSSTPASSRRSVR